MKRFGIAILMTFGLLVLPSVTVNAQDCNYWSCYNEGTTLTTCDITFCFRPPCNGTYFALSCGTRCDVGGGGGGCWCMPSGNCYDI